MASVAQKLGLHSGFELLASGPAETVVAIADIKSRYAALPGDYLDLLNVASELELGWRATPTYLRIWNVAGVAELNEAYAIPETVAGVGIGDDGSGHALVWMSAKSGLGLYKVDFGNLDPADAVWVAPSLKSLLSGGEGIHVVGGK